MNKKSLIAGIVGMSCFNSTNADLLGVADAALFEKAIEQISVLYKQLETMNKSYTKTTQQFNTTKSILSRAEAQLSQMDKLVKKNSGHYGYGQLNNTLNDLRNQKWSADTWHDALKGNGGFNQPKYQQLITEYRKNHLTTSIDEIRKGAADDAVRDYEHTLKVNQAVGVQSEYAYDEVNTSLDRIHKLSQQIENAENTKAAIDLNSRLLTEVAYLQTQNLKSQSLINQQLAQKQSIELSERSRTAKYLAFDDEY